MTQLAFCMAVVPGFGCIGTSQVSVLLASQAFVVPNHTQRQWQEWYYIIFASYPTRITGVSVNFLQILNRGMQHLLVIWLNVILLPVMNWTVNVRHCRPSGHCRNKLEPVVTLHHFVQPLWFDNMGGFTTEAGIPHFVSFATFAIRCVPHMGGLHSAVYFTASAPLCPSLLMCVGNVSCLPGRGVNSA